MHVLTGVVCLNLKSCLFGPDAAQRLKASIRPMEMVLLRGTLCGIPALCCLLSQHNIEHKAGQTCTICKVPYVRALWIFGVGLLLASANVSTRALRLNELNMTRDGLAGAAITSSGPSPSLQFSIPDNNNRSFSLVSPAFYIEGSSVDGTDETGAILTLIAANTTSADSYNTSTLSTAVGAGPDFTCLYFLCCPVVDYLLGDPTTP
jgi:hypothetical protein